MMLLAGNGNLLSGNHVSPFQPGSSQASVKRSHRILRPQLQQISSALNHSPLSWMKPVTLP